MNKIIFGIYCKSLKHGKIIKGGRRLGGKRFKEGVEVEGKPFNAIISIINVNSLTPKTATWGAAMPRGGKESMSKEGEGIKRIEER